MTRETRESPLARPMQRTETNRRRGRTMNHPRLGFGRGVVYFCSAILLLLSLFLRSIDAHVASSSANAKSLRRAVQSLPSSSSTVIFTAERNGPEKDGSSVMKSLTFAAAVDDATSDGAGEGAEDGGGEALLLSIRRDLDQVFKKAEAAAASAGDYNNGYDYANVDRNERPFSRRNAIGSTVEDATSDVEAGAGRRFKNGDGCDCSKSSIVRINHALTDAQEIVPLTTLAALQAHACDVWPYPSVDECDWDPRGDYIRATDAASSLVKFAVQMLGGINCGESCGGSDIEVSVDDTTTMTTTTTTTTTSSHSHNGNATQRSGGDGGGNETAGYYIDEGNLGTTTTIAPVSSTFPMTTTMSPPPPMTTTLSASKTTNPILRLVVERVIPKGTSTTTMTPETSTPPPTITETKKTITTAPTATTTTTTTTTPTTTTTTTPTTATTSTTPTTTTTTTLTTTTTTTPTTTTTTTTTPTPTTTTTTTPTTTTTTTTTPTPTITTTTTPTITSTTTPKTTTTTTTTTTTSSSLYSPAPSKPTIKVVFGFSPITTTTTATTTSTSTTTTRRRRWHATNNSERRRMMRRMKIRKQEGEEKLDTKIRDGGDGSVIVGQYDDRHGDCDKNDSECEEDDEERAVLAHIRGQVDDADPDQEKEKEEEEEEKEEDGGDEEEGEGRGGLMMYRPTMLRSSLRRHLHQQRRLESLRSDPAEGEERDEGARGRRRERDDGRSDDDSHYRRAYCCLDVKSIEELTIRTTRMLFLAPLYPGSSSEYTKEEMERTVRTAMDAIEDFAGPYISDVGGEEEEK